jgi:putative membrane protein
MQKLAAGIIAGAVATVPMSWAMEMMHRLLPARQQNPLPPREISERTLRKFGVRNDLGARQRFWFALIAHLGYGAAVGGIYQAASSSKSTPVSHGIVYGLMVWAGSYLGLLPVLGLLTPATQHPMRRNAVMVLAHIVFGSALAVFSELLLDPRDNGLRFLGSGRRTRGHPREVAGV